MYKRLFADVSSNEGNIDINAYADAGHVLLMIKATEGTSYVNPYYYGWSTTAHRRKVAVAHYHFARPHVTQSATAEVNHFITTIHSQLRPHDYIVLDAESDESNNPPPSLPWVNEFSRAVKARTGKPCIAYANRSDLENYNANGRLEGRLVHDADYSDHPTYAPRGSSPWARQFTDGEYGPLPHELPGIGSCDISRLRWRSFMWLVANRRRIGN